MIKIWGRTDSSNVQKVLWCCGELGIEFERQDWGGKFGGNKDKDYLAMNPNGLVPTLKDGDFILWESNAILMWLAETGWKREDMVGARGRLTILIRKSINTARSYTELDKDGQSA